MLMDPNGCVEAVVACALVVADKFPDRPVLVWVGRATVWEGTGYKSKGDLLLRYRRATGRHMCATMAQLVAGGRIAVVYDLSKFNDPKIMKYAINVLLVFQKKGRVQCYNSEQLAAFPVLPGRYRHDQFFGPKELLDSPEWRFIVVTFGWEAKPVLGVHGIDGFCAKVGAGSLAWHQHIDVVHITLANRSGDLLRDRRGEGGVVMKLPKVADRPGIIAEHNQARLEEAEEAASSGDEAGTGTCGSDRAEGSGSGASHSLPAAGGKRKRKHKKRKNTAREDSGVIQERHVVAPSPSDNERTRDGGIEWDPTGWQVRHSAVAHAKELDMQLSAL
ncbi:hypothetical protein KFL_013190010 [Klebsormidium nitens]|uniref:Uncharacterized protein n=1 Tax=Klebsormidium nitens TaxID=105231 RepID=A0A1Y1IQE7_KLENI|nr:hypothetical protein KFL_013190010 [Klebsormidium nitens]|eukprot:GAQ93135.1 hypothetical protein KFL_013190010 [Klebsormidium nitens]